MDVLIVIAESHVVAPKPVVHGPSMQVGDWRQASPRSRHACPAASEYDNGHYDSCAGSITLTFSPSRSESVTMASSERPLTRASIEAAHELIKPHIHTTPVLTSTTLSNLASTPQASEALDGTPWEGQEPAKPKIRLFFKCENFQRIGAFKVRGAFHAVKRLIEEQGIDKVRSKGVVTHSSGMAGTFRGREGRGGG